MHRPHNFIHLVTLLVLLTFTATTESADPAGNDWELKRDKDGIKVFTRKVEGSSHDAVRAEMVMNGQLNAAVALVRDSAACPEWAELCKEAYEHEVISEQELYVYSYNDIPWPVKDRDALTHVIWQQDPQTLVVTMNAVATTGIVPEQSGAVRIVNAKTLWQFTPVDGGRIEVVSEAHVDPNGPTPSWITNLLLVETPFKTLQGMRRVVQSGRYDESNINFLILPEPN